MSTLPFAPLKFLQDCNSKIKAFNFDLESWLYVFCYYSTCFEITSTAPYSLKLGTGYPTRYDPDLSMLFSGFRTSSLNHSKRFKEKITRSKSDFSKFVVDKFPPPFKNHKLPVMMVWTLLFSPPTKKRFIRFCDKDTEEELTSDWRISDQRVKNGYSDDYLDWVVRYALVDECDQSDVSTVDSDDVANLDGIVVVCSCLFTRLTLVVFIEFADEDETTLGGAEDHIYPSNDDVYRCFTARPFRCALPCH